MSSRSSKLRWLQRQWRDPYVKQAKAEGYICRAAYKLLELNDKDHLFAKGQCIVDLGAAPGGWTQVAKSLVGSSGRVIGLDCLPLEVTLDVDFIQGDFTTEEVHQQLIEVLAGQPVDMVLSDMAPNMSGVRSVDQPRAMYLAELAWSFATEVLREGGTFVAKFFEGEGVMEWQKAIKSACRSVKIRKPDASRAESREKYLVAQGFRRA